MGSSNVLESIRKTKTHNERRARGEIRQRDKSMIFNIYKFIGLQIILVTVDVSSDIWTAAVHFRYVHNQIILSEGFKFSLFMRMLSFTQAMGEGGGGKGCNNPPAPLEKILGVPPTQPPPPHAPGHS